MTPLRALAPIGAIAAVVLTACGTTEEPSTEPDATTESAGPVTVTDARGKEVVLEDGPAEKVVALEWMEAENLVTLGVMPVGVADVKGYGVWDVASPLDDTVEDVGTRQEPSIDSIVGLEPDLVLMEEGREVQAKQLEEYVPVIVVAPSDTKDNIGQMKDSFNLIAEAVGKTDEAEQTLGDFDQTLADATTALGEGGVAGDDFLMADGWTDGGKVSIRPFGKGSLFSDLAEAIGLKNAWTKQVDEVWGLGQTDPEGYLKSPDAHFFYHATSEDNWPETLKKNKIWKDLEFVKNDHVYPLEAGTWTFGGPASSTMFVNQVVEALTS